MIDPKKPIPGLRSLAEGVFGIQVDDDLNVAAADEARAAWIAAHPGGFRG